MVAAHTTQPDNGKLRNTRDPNKRKATDEVVARVLELERAGAGRNFIALDTGLSPSYISKIVTGQMRAVKAHSVKRELGLLDATPRYYLYGSTGEQVAVVDTEDAARTAIENASKLERRNALLKEQRELEKRIRAIQNEIAALDNIPF